MNAALTDEVEITTEEPTVLYRLYAADGSLLYIGITGNLKARLTQHAAEKQWWPEVTRKTATLLPSRTKALEAEAAAIQAERPRHNVKHSVITPLRVDPQPAQKHNNDECLWLYVLKFYIHATENDVRLWHEQMVATGASELGQVFGDWLSNHHAREVFGDAAVDGAA